jgi:uncharacterized membrane protein
MDLDFLAFVGVILIPVGLTHLDDKSPGHIRVGYAALAIGLVLIVVAYWAYVQEQKAKK